MPRPRSGPTAEATPAPFYQQNPDGMLREMERLKAENARLADAAVDALKRAGAGPVEPIEEPVIEHKKLYFIGERMEQGENGMPDYLVPDLRFSESIGLHHTCGRGPMPITFKGSDDDTAPHAFVPVAFGNWLIAEDGARDRHGRMMKARYRWAGES